MRALCGCGAVGVAGRGAGKNGLVSIYDFKASAATFEAIANFKVSAIAREEALPLAASSSASLTSPLEEHFRLRLRLPAWHASLMPGACVRPFLPPPLPNSSDI